MAERDTRADDAAGLPPERDPNALAAWRRVAEQRRRRSEGPGGADGGEGSTSRPERAATPDSGPAIREDPPMRVRRRPGNGSDESAGSRHDLLLAMAGRIDDDALSTVRELASVDDAAAAELLGGCLLADRVAVTDAERTQLDRWFAGARVDPDLLEVLPADRDAPARSRHRFLPDLPGVPTDDGESVARAAARLSGVAHVRQCWRVTPAGGSPGPLPHRVVLVETDSPDDREHVARHVGHAATTLGAVSVEVYATGDPLPAYQRDAVTAARALAGAGPAAVSAPPARPALTAGTRPAGPARQEAPDASLPVRRRSGAGAPSFAALLQPGDGAEPPGASGASDELAGVTDVPWLREDLASAEGEEAEDVEDRRDTEGWRVVADAEPAARDSIADLDPDAAAARIAALWREPSAVDAFDAPLDPHAVGPNLLEPDLPEPDLARELAGYDAPRPVTGSFERVEPDDTPLRSTGRHGSGDEPEERPDHGVDQEARTGGLSTPGADRAPESGRIHRARHSRSGPDDEPGLLADQDVRFGTGSPTARRAGLDTYVSPVDLAAPQGGSSPTHPGPSPAPGAATVGATARREEPPTGPLTVGATAGPGEPTPPAGTGRPDARRTGGSPDTGDAVNSQLSDRERDLLARLHAELAARERLESGEPDPFAADDDAPRRAAPGPAEAPRNGHASASPRPSPTPRPTGPADAARSNGHHHGPTNGHAHGPDTPPNGQVDGYGRWGDPGPRNGHGLPGDPDTDDDGR